MLSVRRGTGSKECRLEDTPVDELIPVQLIVLTTCAIMNLRSQCSERDGYCDERARTALALGSVWGERHSCLLRSSRKTDRTGCIQGGNRTQPVSASHTRNPIYMGVMMRCISQGGHCRHLRRPIRLAANGLSASSCSASTSVFTASNDTKDNKISWFQRSAPCCSLGDCIRGWEVWTDGRTPVISMLPSWSSV